MPDVTEQEVLQGILPDLEAEGYEVYIHPNRALLPPFLKGHAPDAIALRGDRNIAFEISRRTGQGRSKVEQATALFKDQPRWELRILWLDPAGAAESPPVQSEEVVNERIGEVRKLIEHGHAETSLLLGWATFEAVARRLMASRFARPQTPGRMLELLATEGYLTPTETDQLRALSKKRNRLIHGELDVEVSASEMGAFVEILETLRQQPQS